MVEIIDISSSPEPGCSYVQPLRSTLKLGKQPRTQVGPIIELTDSDSDPDDTPVRPRQKKASPRNATPGPSRLNAKQPFIRPQHKLGGSGSLQNIPTESRKSRTPIAKPSPPISPSDEENQPPTEFSIPRSDQPLNAVDNQIDHELPQHAPLEIAFQEPPAQQANEPETEESPIPGYVERILEIIPDVDPDHLLDLVTKFFPTLQGGVVEHILHILFEDPTYPKIDKKGKGKRKETDAEANGEGQKQNETPSKRSKIDYGDKQRPYKGGPHYADLALEQLQIDNPYIPKAYLRQTLASFNGFYAPAYDFLFKQHQEYKQNHELPYVPRTTPFRPSVKRKNRAVQDAEFTMELEWVRSQGEKQDEEVAQEATQEDSSDGIECGCCFSIVAFNKMIQCPEMHLFCSDCMNSYASTLLGSHDPNIKCMDQSGCTAAIPASELRRFLPAKMMELWERVKQRKEVEAAGLKDLEECPFCEWGCVIENEEEKLFRCGNVDTCGAISCRGCKKLSHLPKSCKEMEEDKNLDGRHTIEEAMTRALMRNCPKCQKPFIKENGCNKMTCPNCRTLSCYICRKVITGYEHFNQLPGHQVAPTTSRSTDKCSLWDPVEQKHAEEVKEAAERALAEYKREHPDVDEEKLHVDLPPAPPPPGQHIPGVAMQGLMQNRVDQGYADLRQAMDAIHRLQNEDNGLQRQINQLERQMRHRNPQSEPVRPPRLDVATQIQNHMRRRLRIVEEIANAQARVNDARANIAANARPPPLAQLQGAQPGWNMNWNINHGRQQIIPAPWRPGRNARR